MTNDQTEPATLETIREEIVKLQKILIVEGDTRGRLWIAGEAQILARLARLEALLEQQNTK